MSPAAASRRKPAIPRRSAETDRGAAEAVAPRHSKLDRPQTAPVVRLLDDAGYRASVVLEAALAIVAGELVIAADGAGWPVAAIGRIHDANETTGRPAAAVIGSGSRGRRRIGRSGSVISDHGARRAASPVVADGLGESPRPRIDAPAGIADQLNLLNERRGLKVGLTAEAGKRCCRGDRTDGEQGSQGDVQGFRFHSWFASWVSGRSKFQSRL